MTDRTRHDQDPNLCDSKTKYFFTKPFWAHGVRLKQARNPNVTYMDDTAVRARAGLLHMIAWGIIVSSLWIPQYTIIIYAGPVVIWDMFSGVVFGLTPFCPTGVLGTILSWKLKPFYTPSKPKKFAWTLGGFMACGCLGLRIYIGLHWSIRIIAVFCIILTFLESSLGFCVGCWMFGYLRRVRCCVGCCARKNAPNTSTKHTKQISKASRQSEGDRGTDEQHRERTALKIQVMPRDTPSDTTQSNVTLEMADSTPSPANHEVSDDDNICSA